MTEEPTRLTKEQILTATKEMRQAEVEEYQNNIDNYMVALSRIDTLYGPGHELHADMQDFKEQLQALLKSERREQAKAKLMLDAAQYRISSELGAQKG